MKIETGLQIVLAVLLEDACLRLRVCTFCGIDVV